MEDRAPQAQEMHGKPNIFPRNFKLRYLCDYWELEVELKSDERFRFVFYFLISIRLDLLSWIVNQTGFNQGIRILAKFGFLMKFHENLGFFMKFWDFGIFGPPQRPVDASYLPGTLCSNDDSVHYGAQRIWEGGIDYPH